MALSWRKQRQHMRCDTPVQPCSKFGSETRSLPYRLSPQIVSHTCVTNKTVTDMGAQRRSRNGGQLVGQARHAPSSPRACEAKP